MLHHQKQGAASESPDQWRQRTVKVCADGKRKDQVDRQAIGSNN